MLLIAHIIIALSSIIFATFMMFYPTRGRVRFSTVLLTATLGTGTLLTIQNPGHLLAACLSGLLYFLVIAMLTARAQHRLTTAAERYDA